MAEDLLDYWVRLIRAIFPANTRITSRFSNNDHIIQIDWKPQNDSGNPAKRSKKIEIMIKERTIEDYLDKNAKDRRSSEIMLKEFIFDQYNQSVINNDLHASPYASTERWLISTDVMNRTSSF